MLLIPKHQLHQWHGILFMPSSIKRFSFVCTFPPNAAKRTTARIYLGKKSWQRSPCKANFWSRSADPFSISSCRIEFRADAQPGQCFFTRHDRICIIKLRKINGLVFRRSNYPQEPVFTVSIRPRSATKWETPLPQKCRITNIIVS